MKLEDIDLVYNLLVEGERIGAIKAFRTATDWGLKESKDFVVGAFGPLTPDEFRTKAIDEFVSSPGELLTEFATHVRRLEQIIAQFAELCDSHEGPF